MRRGMMALLLMFLIAPAFSQSNEPSKGGDSKLGVGDTVHITDTPDGFAVTPYDPAFEEQLALGRDFMREYRDTFRALAK